MSEFVVKFLGEQRKRLVGTLMGHMEREVNSSLSPTQRRELRDTVLGAVSTYHGVCLDMLRASVDDGTVVNELAEQLRAELAQMRTDVHTLAQGELERYAGYESQPGKKNPLRELQLQLPGT